MSDTGDDAGLACPLPLPAGTRVLLGHGGGGRLMQELLERLVQPALANPWLARRHDGAVLDLGGARIALTTDGYVVKPLFFPGGDIGRLAVLGTVNDLAMCGARPCHLAASLILEEGLPLATVEAVLASMAAAARETGVSIVTGDTKVVERGKADGLYVVTTGVGLVTHGLAIEPAAVRAGDAVILSGDVGRHGIAILAAREGIDLEGAPPSDCASLAAPVLALLDAGLAPHCLRDLTRGGLAAGLNEIAAGARLQIDIEETAVPVCDAVRGACELLGFDPFVVANEGRFVLLLPPDQAERALEVLRTHAVSADARCIGRVREGIAGQVVVAGALGARRILDLPGGELLPRIC